MQSPYVLDSKQAMALKLLATGMQRREVARLMNSSETTFGRFLTGIYKAMGAHSTIEAVSKAITHGVITMTADDFKHREVS